MKHLPRFVLTALVALSATTVACGPTVDDTRPDSGTATPDVTPATDTPPVTDTFTPPDAMTCTGERSCQQPLGPGVCGDAIVPAVCEAGVYRCPPNTVPSSQCVPPTNPTGCPSEGRYEMRGEACSLDAGAVCNYRSATPATSPCAGGVFECRCAAGRWDCRCTLGGG